MTHPQDPAAGSSDDSPGHPLFPVRRFGPGYESFPDLPQVIVQEPFSIHTRES
jgi:hypothetical protein